MQPSGSDVENQSSESQRIPIRSSITFFSPSSRSINAAKSNPFVAALGVIVFISASQQVNRAIDHDNYAGMGVAMITMLMACALMVYACFKNRENDADDQTLTLPVVNPQGR